MVNGAPVLSQLMVLTHLYENYRTLDTHRAHHMQAVEDLTVQIEEVKELIKVEKAKVSVPKAK